MEHVLTMADLKLKPSLFMPHPSMYPFLYCLSYFEPATLFYLSVHVYIFHANSHTRVRSSFFGMFIII